MTAKVTPYQEVFIPLHPLEDRELIKLTSQRVYALLVQIPSGRITSYKSLSDALNSSPRAIGGALRNNPFAPEVVSSPLSLLAHVSPAFMAFACLVGGKRECELMVDW